MIRLMRVAGTQACLHELLQEGEKRRGNVRTGKEKERDRWVSGGKRKRKELRGVEKKEREQRGNEWRGEERRREGRSKKRKPKEQK